jgi:hypothetical protein
MELPDRWCPVCDEIRTPAICGRIVRSVEFGGVFEADRCGAQTIASAELDAATRARFDQRLAQIFPAGGLSA